MGMVALVREEKLPKKRGLSASTHHVIGLCAKGKKKEPLMKTGGGDNSIREFWGAPER